MSEDLEQKYRDAAAKPSNLGEMKDADVVGTAGSPGCGDMLRIWLKFREEKKKGKVIDKASFQSFGCETAIAVASVATEMLAGKTMEEAQALQGEDLSAPLGPLPPMKVHCASLVEEALKQALTEEKSGMISDSEAAAPQAQGLQQSMQDSQTGGRKIVFD
ncbi:MAG: iron-sulfur cluster assembly scaffold protein [Verrucomicrobiota bacterium]